MPAKNQGHLQLAAHELVRNLRKFNRFPIALNYWAYTPYLTAQDYAVTLLILNNNQYNRRQLSAIIKYAKMLLKEGK